MNTRKTPSKAKKVGKEHAVAAPRKHVTAKPRREVGRPSLYTDKLAAAVCQLVKQGYTLRQIGALPNMPTKTTLINWLDKPEFLDQYARAHEIQALVMEDDIRDIAEDSRNDWVERENKSGGVELIPNEELISRKRLRIDTLRWLMTCKAPKRFGKQVAVTGKDGGPVRVAQVGDILDEISGAGTGLPGDDP